MNTIAYQGTLNHNWLLGSFFLCVAAVILAAPAVRADIYFWQDDQGVIHFSNQEAPPEASLYLREPERVVTAPAQPPPAGSPSAAQQELQTKLERTSQQLERALERVDELTDKVRDSQQEAAVAAAVAQQAAVQATIANAVQPAPAPDYGVRERVVYYSVPYVRHIGGHKHLDRKSLHFKRHHFKHHHKFRHHNKFKHHKWKTHHGKSWRSGTIIHHKPHHRSTIRTHHKSTTRVVPHRTHVRKAYGFR